MEVAVILTTGTFGVLALAHSVMGEEGVIRPLLAAEWSIDIPRRWANRLIRAAWHLTSIAWAAFAAIALGADAMVSLGLAALASALVMLIAVPQHLAWPIFLLGGAAALFEAEAIGTNTMRTAAIAAAVVLVAAGAVHFYWAAGGRRWYETVSPPPREGAPPFNPGPVLTSGVGLALITLAVFVLLLAFDSGPSVVRWLVLVGVVALSARALGDRHHIGFTKTQRTTRFAEADDVLFTPLVTLLAFGCVAALLA